MQREKRKKRKRVGVKKNSKGMGKRKKITMDTNQEGDGKGFKEKGHRLGRQESSKKKTNSSDGVGFEGRREQRVEQGKSWGERNSNAWRKATMQKKTGQG